MKDPRSINVLVIYAVKIRNFTKNTSAAFFVDTYTTTINRPSLLINFAIIVYVNIIGISILQMWVIVGHTLL